MNLKISRILHAGYVFECEKTKIAFDPIFENPFSRNCYAFPEVQFDHDQIRNLKFDAVFISHYHDDHCSLESLDLLDRRTPIYIYCIFDELAELIRELGFKFVHQLVINDPVSIGPFKINPKRALDENVDSLFQIKAAGLNILNVVDSWIDPTTFHELVQEAPWDMILWPFQTMREIEVLSPSRASNPSVQVPPEWIEQLKGLNPKFIVPSSCQFIQESWSWYNHAFFPISYKQFQREIELALPQSKIVRLNPSVSVELNRDSLKSSVPLTWIRPIGAQDVDYEFKSGIRVPSTAEIAQQFPALTAQQSQIVHDYCTAGLLEKYRAMDPSLDPFFSSERFWRLSVYDHQGDVQFFFYKLKGNRIELTNQDNGPLSWTTEVPMAKLYAALEFGESLTSMYMRINDTVFASEIEKEIQSVEVIEDPLVRCLFTGAFASYQKAQLKRLQEIRKKTGFEIIAER